jgi:hypothetical protein
VWYKEGWDSQGEVQAESRAGGLFHTGDEAADVFTVRMEFDLQHYH